MGKGALNCQWKQAGQPPRAAGSLSMQSPLSVALVLLLAAAAIAPSALAVFPFPCTTADTDRCLSDFNVCQNQTFIVSPNSPASEEVRVAEVLLPVFLTFCEELVTAPPARRAELRKLVNDDFLPCFGLSPCPPRRRSALQRTVYAGQISPTASTTATPSTVTFSTCVKSAARRRSALWPAPMAHRPSHSLLP